MKIKLLNDGGYGGLSNIKFPIVVDGDVPYFGGADVSGAVLISAGANIVAFDACEIYYFGDDYCEVLE